MACLEEILMQFILDALETVPRSQVQHVRPATSQNTLADWNTHAAKRRNNM